MPGDDGYVAATAIWAKPSGAMPRAVVHCRTVQDVQSAIRAVRDCDLPLSVRGGGHDWAGRALCGGIAIDLSGMNSVVIEPATHTARREGPALAMLWKWQILSVLRLSRALLAPSGWRGSPWAAAMAP
jgi:hypothetical protein